MLAASRHIHIQLLIAGSFIVARPRARARRARESHHARRASLGTSSTHRLAVLAQRLSCLTRDKSHDYRRRLTYLLRDVDDTLWDRFKRACGRPLDARRDRRAHYRVRARRDRIGARMTADVRRWPRRSGDGHGEDTSTRHARGDGAPGDGDAGAPGAASAPRRLFAERPELQEAGRRHVHAVSRGGARQGGEVLDAGDARSAIHPPSIHTGIVRRRLTIAAGDFPITGGKVRTPGVPDHSSTQEARRSGRGRSRCSTDCGACGVDDWCSRPSQADGSSAATREDRADSIDR